VPKNGGVMDKELTIDEVLEVYENTNQRIEKIEEKALRKRAEIREKHHEPGESSEQK
jgi:DNA-directed RNA polymerase sigma subunit (sigma70/sigma32)